MAETFTNERVAGSPTPSGEPVVVVVDDDESVRETLEDLFKSVGLGVLSFSCSREFLQGELPAEASCLVLDVRMPEESGLELQERLVNQGHYPPIIFITGHADVPMSVRAMKSGAMNFLSKPFRDQELLDAVWEAVRAYNLKRNTEKNVAELRRLAESLTPREVDVLKALDRGLLNKQIAHELGVSEITVKMHRSSAFKKLGAVTVPDMIQKVRDLDLRRRR